jgi:polar amino acid transport system substrate-binding protein
MKKIVVGLLGVLMSAVTFAATLEVNVRNRLPDMVVAGDKYSGPLIDIMETAAERSGNKINWVQASFKRAIEDMKSGVIDFVPRR